MWREKNIYFTEHDIYFTKLMFILKNINLELKSALRTKYIFYRSLLYCHNIRMHLGIDDLPNPATLVGIWTIILEKHGHCLQEVENQTQTSTWVWHSLT